MTSSKRLFASSAGEARIEEVVAFVGERSPAEELVVVGPTRGAVDDVVRRVVAVPGCATFGIHRKTLPGFMAELAAPRLADGGKTLATRLSLEAVARTIADAALRAGKLAYFGRSRDRSPVVEAPSFARALLSTIAELRRRRVEPETLRGRSVAEGDLAELLERYGTELQARGLADVADIAAAALDGLADFPFATRPLALIDVPLDARDQIDFARALITAASRAIVAAPFHDAACLRALDGLALEREDDARMPVTSLERLRARLFAEDAGETSEVDASVEVLSAPSESHEMIEVTRRIVSRARAGVPFDAMAVALPSRHVYAAHLEAALSRARIPSFSSFSTRRPHPAGRALAALIACKNERYSARRFAEYLSLGQVPDPVDPAAAVVRDPFFVPHDEALGRFGTGREPIDPDDADSVDGQPIDREPDDAAGVEGGGVASQAPHRFGAVRAPRRWERLLGEASTWIAGLGESGRAYYERRLTALGAELRRVRAAIEREDPSSARLPAIDLDIADLASLAGFAGPVLDALDALPERAPWEAWVEALSSLSEIALRAPEPVLAILAELRALAGSPPVAVDEVGRVLEMRLLELERPAPGQRFGRVFIGAPRDLRARSFSVVFVPGLTERTFPARVREDPLLSDALRRGLDVDLPTNDERSHDERLALLLAVGAARDALVLSYPRVEAELGRPRVPSFYALDVARALHGQLPDVVEMQRGDIDRGATRLEWPAPRDADRAIDRAEHDLAVLRGLLDAPRATRTEGLARYLLDDSAHLRRSLRARYSRFDMSGITVHDGLVKVGERTRKVLSGLTLSARPHSVTSLEAYAACPYRFYLASIARVAPRDEHSRSESLAPATRGDLFHRVAAEIALSLRDRGALPLAPEAVDAAKAELRERFAVAKKSLEAELQPSVERIFEEDCDEVLADLEHLVVSDLSTESDFVPVAADWGFGVPAHEHLDPRSAPDAAVLTGGQRLRGAIDSIEESRTSGAIRITDYKTGLARDRGPLVVGGGEVLQPLLYALSARMLGFTGRAGTIAEARLFYATKRGGYESRTVKIDAPSIDRAELALHTIDDAIQDGFFMARPRKDACAVCSYVAICGTQEESRAGRKLAGTPSEKRHLDALETLRRQP